MFLVFVRESGVITDECFIATCLFTRLETLSSLVNKQVGVSAVVVAAVVQVLGGTDHLAGMHLEPSLQENWPGSQEGCREGGLSPGGGVHGHTQTDTQ